MNFWKSLVFAILCPVVAFGSCPANVPAGVTICHYFDYVSGSDSNTGVDETHAWQHMPTCANATSNSVAYTPVAGEGWIFKGGVVDYHCWLANVPWGRTLSASDYIGYDPSWYNSAIVWLPQDAGSSVHNTIIPNDESTNCCEAVIVGNDYISGFVSDYDNINFISIHDSVRSPVTTFVPLPNKPHGKSTVDLTWAPSTTPNAVYTVFRSTNPGSCLNKAVAWKVSGTSYVDHNVTRGITYYYSVAALKTGITCSSEVSVTVP